MHLNIDIAIFVVFLLANLIVGLRYGKGVRTIKDYALGGRNFTTGTITATLIATWIGGGFFAWNLSKAYTDGLPFMIAVLGNGIALFVLGFFYSPRMGEFLGCNSVAEAMGNLYGKHVRIITSIAAICLSIGYTGLQIKVMSSLLSWSFDINGTYAAIGATFVVIIYSTFGGIRSVTFTDVIQFFTFGAFVPGLAMLIWGSFDDPQVVFDVVKNNSLFDYSPMLSMSWVALVIWFILPGLDPALFQRVLIAKNVGQVQRSFNYAALGCVVIIMTTSIVGLLVLAKNPGVVPDKILTYIIDNYSYVGIRGITMAGIAAMVMSTVDSYINSASVLFANDFCRALGLNVTDNARGLLFSRIFAVVSGLFALVIALSNNNLFDLTLVITNFYMPIVTVPLTLAIFGFRSTSKAVLIGIAGGIVTLIVWRLNFMHTGVDSVIPAMTANFICLLLSHYILRQEGGWVGIKDPEPLRLIRLERRRNLVNLMEDVLSFSLLDVLKRNTPKQEYAYSYFAIFSIVSIFSTIYTLPQEVRLHNNELLDFIYHSALISSTVFLTYPIWPATFKSENVMSIIWNVSIYYTLVCISTILVCVSNFSQFQVMIFVLNIFVITTFITQKIAFILVPICSVLTVKFYQYYVNEEIVTTGIDSLQFKVIYSLLLVSSVLIAFLRPKQEYQEKIEQKSDYLENQLEGKTQELQKAIELKYEFLRNLQHESRTPITGITSMGQVLDESYDKLSEEQRRLAIKEIAKSSTRLSSLVNNLIDLSQLQSLEYQLSKKEVDLSDLVYKRVALCRKLYIEDKKRDKQEFVLDIEDDIVLNCDEHYMLQVIDNVVVNAIQYCQEGKIEIKLISSPQGEVVLTVSDEGIGVPVADLDSIFGVFTVSSRTKSQAGGRGVGLALCKRIVELHGGDIAAIPNKTKGVTFRIRLPR